ncbi:MAG: FAD-dependent oxidoreductase [SAR324 cluster bacterium]|jgi:glycine/D-amino acid oxidase-like deaminating enzyme|nr:FAD-dependent oxidoreductase [Nitrospinaceae bacterium]MDP7582039.1 FAD-dependent oxidoreductase [SAR324 cluster bacterium]|tara:strand:- start:3460 stop:4569 length:1110 start_codon:yes stop_codon:yes gene_type:complete
MESSDILVIGGGIIGGSVAYGMAKQGFEVTLLNQGGSSPSASRGNFGLTWVQSKGLGMPRYAEWTLDAVQSWPEFSEDLEENSGISVDFDQPGGFEACLGEEEWRLRKTEVEQMRQESVNGNYDCEMLDRQTMQEMIPKLRLGETVYGASFSPHDGHINPLALLSSLMAALKNFGIKFFPGNKVVSVSFQNGCFEIRTTKQRFSSKKIVLACGLGIKSLARQVGMDIPLRPQRGQILVTERTHPLLMHPFVTLRQTREGSFMIGASHEEVNFDSGTTLDVMRSLANHALKLFPELSSLQLVRCWGALRILTPDNIPVYVESESCPGAFVVSSHSGITLAPLHAGRLSKWIVDGRAPQGLEKFHPGRFDA